MLKVVQPQHVCEVHPDQLSKLIGFQFFWPQDGRWYKIEPCNEDADQLQALLGPFIERADALPNQTVVASSIPTADLPEPPLPPGWVWRTRMNGQTKTGRGKTHATPDLHVSRCNLIADDSNQEWATDPPVAPDDERCRPCVNGLNLDARKGTRQPAGKMGPEPELKREPKREPEPHHHAIEDSPHQPKPHPAPMPAFQPPPEREPEPEPERRPELSRPRSDLFDSARETADAYFRQYGKQITREILRKALGTSNRTASELMHELFPKET